MASFFHLRSTKFPVLPGEAEELVNPGTYGKALALYLQEQLSARGYEVPSICCEDWGWWVTLCLPGKTIGLCCYRAHEGGGECEFACSTSLEKPRSWSWKRFGFIDLSDELARLSSDLKAIFESDPDIDLLGEVDEFPL